MKNVLNVLCREQKISEFEKEAIEYFATLANGANKIEYDKIEILYDYTLHEGDETVVRVCKEQKNVLISTLGQIKLNINEYSLVLNDIASWADIGVYNTAKKIGVEVYFENDQAKFKKFGFGQKPWNPIEKNFISAEDAMKYMFDMVK